MAYISAKLKVNKGKNMGVVRSNAADVRLLLYILE